MQVINEAPNYSISIKGEVFRKGKRPVKPFLSRHGYIEVPLRITDRTKFRKIHRLLAIAYIKNPDNKPEVNHINGIKTDNRLENLEWVTRSENQKHAFKIGLNSNKGILNGRAKLNLAKVESIRSLYPIKTLKELSIQFGVCLSTIHKVVTKRHWV